MRNHHQRRGEDFYYKNNLLIYPEHTSELGANTKLPSIIVNAKAKSERVHYLAKERVEERKPGYGVRQKSTKQTENRLMHLCKAVNNINHQEHNKKPQESLEGIANKIKQKGGYSFLGEVGQADRNRRGCVSNKIHNAMQSISEDIKNTKFSRSYLEYIGLKQAKWHNTKITKRGSNFMLSLYRSSVGKNLDEIRTRILFGAFGVRKGVRIRFAL